ncbi:LysR family transcriptional regulator [Noviherbaspirillum denitrificans]|uniref:LysR family transcriptional regulator n=1 Tax=Noviherbaspirillum denitrificans TaxID=1968433 RepID=A0A254TFS6_9BURK|nr:LysR family transcriptional regulator [Noviherbaspirillum denitrificans]OWW21375.1 LysR family transcriptional regulator [Noviherbaspirillum denitrificans]
MGNRKPTQRWDDFRYFLAVVRTGTLSAAADLLDTQHTTVARHIQALEEQLDARLFLKSNTGYGLTPAGERLLELAETIESSILAARGVANQRDKAISGTVRIGAPDGLGSTFLAPRMHILTDKHPALNIEIMATTRIFSLSKREAHIAIGFSRTEHARIVSRRLTDYRLFVYASADYLQSAPSIKTKEDFRQHPFIGYVEEFVFFPELDYLNAVVNGITPKLRSTNLLAQLYATLSGGGLCILPVFIASNFPNLVAVLPEQVSLTRSFHMHIHEDHRKAPHVRAVADFIAAEIETNEQLFLAKPGETILQRLPFGGATT